MDLLELTNDIRLKREIELARQRGEVHPEERKQVEEALDKKLSEIGVVEINGIKFNEFKPPEPPVSRRRRGTGEKTTKEESGAGQGKNKNDQ